MCGIFATGAQFEAGPVLKAMRHRGPDAESAKTVGPWTLGHVRMSVIDLDSRSDQPFTAGKITLSYNGELWNYRELREQLRLSGREFRTEGDTEVFAVALDEWGTDALRKFEGMFAAAWTDGSGNLFLARDRFGEVPLHAGWLPSRQPVACSELKALRVAGVIPSTVWWVPPGGLVRFAAGATRPDVRRYYTLIPDPASLALPDAAGKVVELLGEACRERAMSDVPVAVLLSGGVDSSAIAALLKPHVPGLVGYTAVHKRNSRDHRLAVETARMLGIPLTEVVIPAPSPDDLATVVRAIEHDSKAQVEIGWACLRLAERIRGDGVKVVFTGEGSDELWASYGTSFHGIEAKGWHEYRREVFVGQHRKNFARCNKVFMTQGIEARLPFLHTKLVEWGMSLPPEAVFRSVSGSKRSGEKWHMRSGFAGLIPASVCERAKEAFQTGAGLDEAAALAVCDPIRFYRAEFRNQFKGIEI